MKVLIKVVKYAVKSGPAQGVGKIGLGRHLKVCIINKKKNI